MLDSNLRRNLRRAYDARAAERDGRALADWKLALRAEFLSRLQSEGRHRLLEIGAGPGHDSAYFAGQGLDVTSIDLSAEMARRCAQKGLTAVVMDSAALAFRTGAFEAAYSMNCLLHLPKRELPLALAGIARVLAPGALFYLGVYGGIEREDTWDDDAYEPKRLFSLYSDAHLQAVVGRFFAIEAFAPLPIEDPDHRLHFQSLVLRNRTKGQAR
jgi:SAM-dependent methyltransferase